MLHSNIRKVRNQPRIKCNFYLKLSNSSNNLILYNNHCQLHLRRQEVLLLGSTILPRTRIQTRNRHILQLQLLLHGLTFKDQILRAMRKILQTHWRQVPRRRVKETINLHHIQGGTKIIQRFIRIGLSKILGTLRKQNRNCEAFSRKLNIMNFQLSRMLKEI